MTEAWIIVNLDENNHAVLTWTVKKDGALHCTLREFVGATRVRLDKYQTYKITDKHENCLLQMGNILGINLGVNIKTALRNLECAGYRLIQLSGGDF